MTTFTILRPTTRRAALSGLTALTALGMLALPLAAHAATPPVGACTDESGITVVVDKTDLGGEVEVGCAEGGAPDGTSALRAAGFTDTRDDAGMICAIDALPDPCPTTWEGSYWSYWSAEGGEWVAYQVGSDTSTPAAGGIEGWRYNDGSTGPGTSPADLAPSEDAGSEEVTEAPADDGTEAGTDTDGDGAQEDGSSAEGQDEAAPWTTWAVVGAVVVLTAAVVALLLAARARRARG